MWKGGRSDDCRRQSEVLLFGLRLAPYWGRRLSAPCRLFAATAALSGSYLILRHTTRAPQTDSAVGLARALPVKGARQADRPVPPVLQAAGRTLCPGQRSSLGPERRERVSWEPLAEAVPPTAGRDAVLSIGSNRHGPPGERPLQPPAPTPANIDADQRTGGVFRRRLLSADRSGMPAERPERRRPRAPRPKVIAPP